MASITQTLVLESLECGDCHIWFALETHFLKRLQQEGTAFFCPNGHRISYGNNEFAKVKAEKLRLESQLEYERDRRARAEKEVIVNKGRATRFKNERDKVARRAHNGTCPYCSRTFARMQSHIRSKHPGCEMPAPPDAA